MLPPSDRKAAASRGEICTAPITTSKGKQERQNAFLDALRTLPDIEITFGRFQPDPKSCDKCGHANFHPQEKKTDVNIATNLICDAIDDKFDSAILVPADWEIVSEIEAVKRLKPGKRITVAFPPWSLLERIREHLPRDDTNLGCGFPQVPTTGNYQARRIAGYCAAAQILWPERLASRCH